MPSTPARGHAHPHLHAHGQLGHGFPVLDIGGDVGALVLYTPAELEGLEIEVSLVAEPGQRTHTEILRRAMAGRTFWAGVYAELPAGDYRIWYDDEHVQRTFTVAGGQVAEVDWR